MSDGFDSRYLLHRRQKQLSVNYNKERSFISEQEPQKSRQHEWDLNHGGSSFEVEPGSEYERAQKEIEKARKEDKKTEPESPESEAK